MQKVFELVLAGCAHVFVGGRRAPVLFNLRHAVAGLPLEAASRLQLSDTLSDRPGSRNVVERHQIADGYRIDLSKRSKYTKRFQRGRNNQRTVLHRPAERLDTQPISRAKRKPSHPVPDDERKHAVQLLYDGRAPTTITLEDHLCIRTGVEDGPVEPEVITQFAIVVDLPIEHDDIS